MPTLLATMLLACVAIEAFDTWNIAPPGPGAGHGAAILSSDLARALVKGCLAASVEIAVFRHVLLGEVADRPVWRSPARYTRYVVYGLGLGCGLALLIGLLPWLRGGHRPWLAAAIGLGFAVIAAAMLGRSVALFRRIASEALGVVPGNPWPALRTHWSRLVGLLLWQIVLGLGVALVLYGMGSGLGGLGVPDARLICRHMTPIIQSVIGSYAFAASFCVLYRSLQGPGRDAPRTGPRWDSVGARAAEQILV
jgi:hypothetical protein